MPKKPKKSKEPRDINYFQVAVSHEGSSPFVVARDDLVQFGYLIRQLFLALNELKLPKEIMRRANEQQLNLDKFVMSHESNPESFNADEYLELKKALLIEITEAASVVAARTGNKSLNISLEPTVFKNLSPFQSKFYAVAGLLILPEKVQRSAQKVDRVADNVIHAPEQQAPTSSTPKKENPGLLRSFFKMLSVLFNPLRWFSSPSEEKPSVKNANAAKQPQSDISQARPITNFYKSTDHSIALGNVQDFTTLMSLLRRVSEDTNYVNKLNALEKKVSDLCSDVLDWTASKIFSEDTKQQFNIRKKEILDDMAAITGEFLSNNENFRLDQPGSSGFQMLYARVQNERITTTAELFISLKIDPENASVPLPMKPSPSTTPPEPPLGDSGQKPLEETNKPVIVTSSYSFRKN